MSKYTIIIVRESYTQACSKFSFLFADTRFDFAEIGPVSVTQSTVIDFVHDNLYLHIRCV